MNTEKIKLFIQGRKGLLPKIEAACGKEKDIIWFHVASYGEFEEARPVIEATRKRFPQRKILLTVFSPTVFVPMQHYPVVDWVFYLPLDTPWNVRRFLNAVRPVKAVFTLTDFWPVLLNALRRRKIDTYIMSLHLEAGSKHLKRKDFLFRQIIRKCYKCVMVQDKETYRLLSLLGIPQMKVTGDPRMDRVVAVTDEPWNDSILDEWSRGEKVFVAGSTYEPENRLMLEIANAHPESRFLIVPHEIEDAQVNALLEGSLHGATRYTDYHPGAQILVVDTVGMLSRLYRYGYAAYVGGAFTEGAPHSVVEPASYGIPVAFGPQYRRDAHCRDFVAMGVGVSVSSREELEAFYQKTEKDTRFREEFGHLAADYCRSRSGATQEIMKEIFGPED